MVPSSHSPPELLGGFFGLRTPITQSHLHSIFFLLNKIEDDDELEQRRNGGLLVLRDHVVRFVLLPRDNRRRAIFLF